MFTELKKGITTWVVKQPMVFGFVNKPCTLLLAILDLDTRGLAQVRRVVEYKWFILKDPNCNIIAISITDGS